MLDEVQQWTYKELEQIDVILSKSHGCLLDIVNENRRIEQDLMWAQVTKREMLRKLSMEVELLFLDFTIPSGSSIIELKKGGMNEHVTQKPGKMKIFFGWLAATWPNLSFIKAMC